MGMTEIEKEIATQIKLYRETKNEIHIGYCFGLVIGMFEAGALCGYNHALKDIQTQVQGENND